MPNLLLIFNTERLWESRSLYIYIYFFCEAASNIEQVQVEAPHKAAVVRPSTTHHENYQN